MADQNAAYIGWKGWTSETFNVCRKKDATTYKSELMHANVTIKPESAVLEIGFGNATFAAWVMRQTKHYVGTEKNAVLVGRAIQNGIEAYPAALDLATIVNDRTFDLVAIFDVLEHLDLNDAIQLLTSIAQHLSPSGRLIVRVPSGDSPFSGHLMSGDITHKLKLGRFAFFQLAELADLEVISVRDAAYPIFGMGGG